MTKQIIYLDHSCFKQSNCLKRLEFISIQGLSPFYKSVAIEFGSAFHVYIKWLTKGNPHEESLFKALTYYSEQELEIDVREFRTATLLAKACNEYYEQVWKFDTFKILKDKTGEALVEKTFAFPIYISEQLEILLTGTIDAIGTQEGLVTGLDRKTTAVWNIEEYLRLYQLSSQLMFYNVACKLVGFDFWSTMSWRIDGIFLRKDKVEFRRSEPISFSKKQLAIFESHIRSIVHVIAQRIEFGIDFEENFLCCDNSKYDAEKVGRCKFASICERTSPEERMIITESMFRKKKYEPLKFGKPSSLERKP